MCGTKNKAVAAGHEKLLTIKPYKHTIGKISPNTIPLQGKIKLACIII